MADSPFSDITIKELSPNEQSESKGPPKQALNAITGIPILAIVRFDTKSPIEFPKANTVEPSMSSLNSNTTATALITAIISVAKKDIQIKERTNPKKDPK